MSLEVVDLDAPVHGVPLTPEQSSAQAALAFAAGELRKLDLIDAAEACEAIREEMLYEILGRYFSKNG
jgi:hypothetical protein